MKPPEARQQRKVLVAHGHRRVDEYYWLNRRDDPEVIDHLESENRHTAAVLGTTGPLQATLVAEMRSRMAPDESSVPYREGGYFYYYRYEPDREYPLYCRRRGSLDAAEEVMFDSNRMAAGHDYFSLAGFTVSPDGRRAAFGVDTVGDRFYTVHFLDLVTGELLDESIADVTADIEWAADSRTVLYTRQHRETMRHYQVHRYTLGGNAGLVYQEDDVHAWLGVERSLSGEYFYLVSESTLSTEVRYLPLSAPASRPSLFLAREEEHEYYVTDGRDRFFILSNDGAVNFRVFECPLGDTSREAWQEFVPHRDNVLIDGLDVFAGYIALNIVEDGLDQIEIIDRKTGRRSRVDFDEPAYTACTVDNHEYETDLLRYAFESPITPETTVDYAFDGGARTIVRRDRVPGGFDRSDYVSERRMATVRDGTRVPVSIVYRRDLRPDGAAPMLVYGYGSYGISSEPDFDTDIFCLLDRGFIYAIAHVRGGSELGRPWYYSGRRRDKMNTFLDFIDVTRFLHGQGYSSPAHTYATGGSAGGLLVGAVANLAPGLYNGICARVPFVDIVTAMLDESLPLTTGEYDEWGNPADRDAYLYMLGYSPYDNVRQQAYPHMLVTAGLHDTQVPYWQPAKWVARLRARRADDNLVLLRTDLGAGHSGKTGRYRRLADTALIYAFFLMLEDLAGDT